jgi:hypothetical protein
MIDLMRAEKRAGKGDIAKFWRKLGDMGQIYSRSQAVLTQITQIPLVFSYVPLSGFIRPGSRSVSMIRRDFMLTLRESMPPGKIPRLKN